MEQDKIVKSTNVAGSSVYYYLQLNLHLLVFPIEMSKVQIHPPPTIKLSKTLYTHIEQL